MSTIQFQCYVCSQVLKVGADKAGRKAKCIQCGTVLTIPMASAVTEELVTPTPVEPPPPAQPIDLPTAEPIAPPPPPARGDRYDDDDDEYRDRDRRRGREDDVDDDYDRPRRRRDRDDDFDDEPRGRRRRDDYDDDYDRPRRKEKKTGSKGSWPMVRLGFLISFIGWCVVAGGFALQQIGMLIFTIASLGRGAEAGMAAFRCMQFGSILVVLASIAPIVGAVMWIFGKNKNGTLGLAITTVAVLTVVTLLHLVFVLIPAFSFETGRFVRIPRIALGAYSCQLQFGGGIGDLVLSIFLNILVNAGWLIGALYIRAVALTLKDRFLREGAMRLVIMTSVAAGYQLLFPLMMQLFGSGARGGTTTIMIFFNLLYWAGAGLAIWVVTTVILQTWQAKSLVEEV